MSGTRRGAAPEFTARVLPDTVQPSGSPAAFVAGQQMDSIGDRILRIAERQQNRLDAAAQEDAQTAGLAAGDAEPGVQMEGGGEIYRRAFNRAAVEGASMRLENTARTEIDRIGRENQANPQGFASAFAAWRDGTLENMPDALRVRVGQRLDGMASVYARSIQEQSDRAVADEAGAAFMALLPNRMASIQRSGQRLATDPAARGDLDRDQAALRSDLITNGPRHGFIFDGVEYPADATRTGRFSLQQMEEIQRTARDAEIENIAIGAFRQGGQTSQALEAWRDSARRGEIDPNLRPDQVDRIYAALHRDMAQARAAQTEAQRAARIELQPRLDADRVAIAERGAPTSGILDSDLSAAGINVRQYRAQEAARMAGWQAQQDLQGANTPQRAQEIADRFAVGGALFHADPETAARVLQFARSRGAHIAGENLQAAVRDRTAELAANASRAAAPFSIDQAVRMLERTESGGRANIGDHDGAGPGSASGLLGITQGMWDTWAARAGVADRDRNDPEAQRRVARVFLEAQEQWARQALGRGLSYADVRGAWFLGEAGWRAMVQAPAGADAFGVYSQAAGAGIAAQAFDNPRNRAVLQRGRTAGEVMAALAAQAGEGAWRPGWTPAEPIVSPEEARQAGWTPEQAARISADAVEVARQAALRQRALTASPEERQQIEAELAVVGDRAAENARLLTAWNEALTQRDRGMAQDPAGYVAQTSPVLQGLYQRVVAGDTEALPSLIDGLATEQARQGVPEGQRRILPQGLVTALSDSVVAAPTPQQGLERLRALHASIGQDNLVRVMQQARLTGGEQDTRRDIAAVAATRVGTDPTLAGQILQGLQVLRESPPANMPQPRMSADADAELGQAFAASPGARDAVLAAARAIYAAELNAAGKLGQAYDSSAFRAAIARVAPTTSFNGARVPVPSGMDANGMHRTLDRLPAAAMADAAAVDGRRFTSDMLQHGAARLIAVGDGRFQVQYNGMSVMSASRPSAPFVLDLRNTAPVPPPPTGRQALQPAATGARRIEGWDDPAGDVAPTPRGPSPAEQNWQSGRSQIGNEPVGARLFGRGRQETHPVSGRPIIENGDGTFSTEESITVEVDDLNGGRPTNIPTIWNGQRLSEEQAIEAAVLSGLPFQGYDNVDAAVRAARERSDMLGRTRRDRR